MFENKTLKEVWEELGNVPINEQELTEQPFYDFPAGTEKYGIWQAIEEYYNVSIGKYLETGKW